MKSLALVSLLVVSAMAGEILQQQQQILVEPVPQFNQEQNTATGEYGYSYQGGPSAKTEFRASDGTTTGSYSYVDAHGLLQTVNYIADEFGFRAAGSNIPSDGVAPLDAPDVAYAKAAHLAEHSRQTLNALHRNKRGIYAQPILAAAPAAVEVRHTVPAIATTSYTQNLPVATSHQSRFQIHNGAKIVEQVHTPLIATAHVAPVLAAPAHHVPLLFRKKRGIFAAEAPIAVAAAPLPPSSAKIYDELAQRPALAVAAAPVAIHAAPAAAVEVRHAVPAIATTSYTQNVPLATSSQSRFQIHNGAKIVEQVHTPLIATAHHVPLLFRKKRGIYAQPILAAAAPAAVEVRHAVPALATTSYTQNVPVATSHQSRFQVHNGGKVIEQTSFPAAIPAAVYPGSYFAPAPIAPVFPSEAVIAAGSDAISVESA